jgi:hypothetical protein
MNEPAYPFHLAYETACLFIANVRHLCQCVEIAGSLRRHLSRYGTATSVPAGLTVREITLVAIPLLEEIAAQLPLFDRLLHTVTHRNLLWESVDTLYQPWPTSYTWQRARRRIAAPRPGNTDQPLPLDLRLASHATWGYHLATATGPALWSHALHTSRRAGGLRPDYLRHSRGQIYIYGKLTPVPEEHDYLALLGLPNLRPHERGLRALREIQGYRYGETA